jgi:hypothetical protein
VRALRQRGGGLAGLRRETLDSQRHRPPIAPPSLTPRATSCSTTQRRLQPLSPETSGGNAIVRPISTLSPDRPSHARTVNSGLQRLKHGHGRCLRTPLTRDLSASRAHGHGRCLRTPDARDLSVSITRTAMADDSAALPTPVTSAPHVHTAMADESALPTPVTSAPHLHTAMADASVLSTPVTSAPHVHTAMADASALPSPVTSASHVHTAVADDCALPTRMTSAPRSQPGPSPSDPPPLPPAWCVQHHPDQAVLRHDGHQGLWHRAV